MVHHRAGRLLIVVAVLGGVTLAGRPAFADEQGGNDCRGERRSCTEPCPPTPPRGARTDDVGDSGRRPRSGRDEGAFLLGGSGRGEDQQAGEDDACAPAPVVPEAPAAVLLPMSAVAVGGAYVLLRRRRAILALPS